MDSLFDVFNTGASRKARQPKAGLLLSFTTKKTSLARNGARKSTLATQEPVSKKLKEDGIDEDAGGKAEKVNLNGRLSKANARNCYPNKY